MSLVHATLLTAVLFGFWHVPGVIAGADDADDVATVVSAAAGTVVATTVAGLVFIWLRRRSDSLLAPMLAHVRDELGGVRRGVSELTDSARLRGRVHPVRVIRRSGRRSTLTTRRPRCGVHGGERT